MIRRYLGELDRLLQGGRWRDLVSGFRNVVIAALGLYVVFEGLDAGVGVTAPAEVELGAGFVLGVGATLGEISVRLRREAAAGDTAAPDGGEPH